MRKCRITISSLPDRENLVAEISYNNIQFAEINQEADELKIQFYPHPKEGFWEFSVDEILNSIEKAKKRLIEVG